MSTPMTSLMAKVSLQVKWNHLARQAQQGNPGLVIRLKAPRIQRPVAGSAFGLQKLIGEALASAPMHRITYSLDNSCNAVWALSHSLILATEVEHELYSEHALGFVLSVSSDSRKMPVVRLAEIRGIFWELRGWGWPCMSRYWELCWLQAGAFSALSLGWCLPTFYSCGPLCFFFLSKCKVCNWV